MKQTIINTLRSTLLNEAHHMLANALHTHDTHLATASLTLARARLHTLQLLQDP